MLARLEQIAFFGGPLRAEATTLRCGTVPPRVLAQFGPEGPHTPEVPRSPREKSWGMRARAFIALLITGAMNVVACAADGESPSRSRAAEDAAVTSPTPVRPTGASQTTASSSTTAPAEVAPTTVPPSTTSATAADGNLRVEASLADSTVAPSEFVEFAVRVTDADADKVRVVWEFGDGTRTRIPAEPAACADQPSTRPIDTVNRQRHAYRYPGSYRAVLHVLTGPQQCLSEPAVEQVTLELEVHVTDGSTDSNGPEAADLRFVQDRDTEDGSVAMSAYAVEYDGYLVRAVIDWGDGSPLDTLERTTEDCHEPDLSWPESTWLLSPLVHRYEHDGVFTVTITFVSTGCDGQDEQSTSTTAEARPRQDAPVG